MEKALLFNYLDCRRLPLEQTAGAVSLHNALCEAAPEFYLYLLAEPRAALAHRQRILLNLIVHPAAREIDWRLIVEMLRRVHATEGLMTLEIMRTAMMNRRRARSMALSFLVGHEQFPDLAAGHRQRIIRLLKHFLGEQRWSEYGRVLDGKLPESEPYLQRKLLRYAQDEAIVRETLKYLAGVAFIPTHPALVKIIQARTDIQQGAGLSRETLFGLREQFDPKPTDSQIRKLAAQKASPTHSDGPLTALYKGGLAGEQSAEAVARTATERLEEVAATLPAVDARLAVVLDLSGSAASSGERVHHPAALGLALVRLLGQRVRQVSVHLVGGSAATLEDGALPRPEGVSDLASGIIAAARQEPQMILVITDGYENLRQGDAAEVARGLRQLDMRLPIYQLVPLFAANEDFAQRSLGEPIQMLPLEHEAGVGEVLARVWLAAAPEELSPAELEPVKHLLLGQSAAPVIMKERTDEPESAADNAE